MWHQICCLKVNSSSFIGFSRTKWSETWLHAGAETAGSDTAEQDRTRQERTGEGRAGQGRSGQDWPGIKKALSIP